MPVSIEIKNANAWYKAVQAIKNVTLSIPPKSIYALIGPSGCGKTTLLRSINRLNDLVPGFTLKGEILVNGVDAYKKTSAREVQIYRRGIGMVFQQPNPLPMSILHNLTLPVKEWVHCSEADLMDKAVEKLKQVALYDEVKDRLNKTAFMLSGGQQQRLCIARALMLDPEILLMDEPCSALDPISTYKIENLLTELKEKYTIVVVTHNMHQAARISGNLAFFYRGDMIESGATDEKLNRPQTELLANYVTGKF